MAQAEISGLALRFDMTDADHASIWPAVGKVTARELAVHMRDGAPTEGTGPFPIPVGGSSLRPAAVTGGELVAVEAGPR